MHEGAFGIIGSACTVHAVSLTPHACKINFRTTSKSENHRQNGFAMQKRKNVCGVIDSAFTIEERF
jgi:hypothetical protein